MEGRKEALGEEKEKGWSLSVREGEGWRGGGRDGGMEGWMEHVQGEDRNSVVVLLWEDTDCTEVRWVIRP